MNLEAIQNALKEANLDGWLFYDHHHRDPFAYRILSLDPNSFVSRRWFYYLPATGTPKKLVHRIESGKLDSLEGTREEYSSWQELEQKLTEMLVGATNIAMQYSPRNAIMYVAMVDAGTVELIRSFGKTVVSSANLISQFEAVLTAPQIETHFEAQRRLDEILRAGFTRISEAVRGSGTTEFQMVQFLQTAIERAGLFTDHGPNVSTGPNSADSHYEPTDATSRKLALGDFLLIDIWAKLPDSDAVWYDITWTGVIGREPSTREQLVFSTVRDARIATTTLIRKAFAAGTPIQGWEADDAARAVIAHAGFAPQFTHRTGHSIATDLHGPGAHLDNLETHDERLILPNTCFSVEPGIYFPGEFGVRSEVDMITHSGEAVVSGPEQMELLRL